MVSNERLIEIAAREGLTATDREKLSDAFEVEVAERFFAYGFKSVRKWLEQIYDKDFDLQDEVRRILEPAPIDKIERQVRGALKSSLRDGTLTDLQRTTRIILRVLRDAGSI
jgi:RecJ-like exonuclease